MWCIYSTSKYLYTLNTLMATPQETRGQLEWVATQSYARCYSSSQSLRRLYESEQNANRVPTLEGDSLHHTMPCTMEFIRLFMLISSRAAAQLQTSYLSFHVKLVLIVPYRWQWFCSKLGRNPSILLILTHHLCDLFFTVKAHAMKAL